MTLAIVIPTLVRPTLPRTVQACRTALRDTSDAHIEVWVNRRYPLTWVQRELLRDVEGPLTDVYFHDEWHATAEASAMFAASRAHAEWVWIVGDDDTPLPGAVSLVQDHCDGCADLWLLNWVVANDSLSSRRGRYYALRSDATVLSSERAFEQLGFVTTLTTLSSIVLRSSVIDMPTFVRLHALSGIYSHIFTLRCWLRDLTVGLIEQPLLMRHERSPHQIAADISKALPPGQHSLFPWTAGLWRLALEVSDSMDTSPAKLLSAREAELVLRPDGLWINRSTTRRVLYRFWQELLRSEDDRGQQEILEELASSPVFFETMHAASRDQQLVHAAPLTFDLKTWGDPSDLRSDSPSTHTNATPQVRGS